LSQFLNLVVRVYSLELLRVVGGLEGTDFEELCRWHSYALT